MNCLFLLSKINDIFCFIIPLNRLLVAWVASGLCPSWTLGLNQVASPSRWCMSSNNGHGVVIKYFFSISERELNRKTKGKPMMTSWELRVTGRCGWPLFILAVFRLMTMFHEIDDYKMYLNILYPAPVLFR